MFLDFPNSRKEWHIAFYGGKSLGEKLDQVKVTVELNFLFQSPSPRVFKKERKPSKAEWPWGRECLPQFSFPACAQERLARFKLPFRR